MTRRIILFIFLFLSINLHAGFVEDPNNVSDFFVVIKKLRKEGKLTKANNLIGIYNYISKKIKKLSTVDGFTELSVVAVPFIGILSLFISKDQLDQILDDGADNISNKVYKVSQCIGQVQGAYDYGNQSGKRKMKYKFIREAV